ncbi:MAG: alpha/beta hydrolase [Pseudomonadota bacterium]
MRKHISIAVIIALAAVDWHTPATASELTLTPCRIDAGNAIPTAKALCGEFEVAEDPARPDGKTIVLSVAMVPALSVAPEPDPIVFLAGGPGQSAIESYLGVRGAFAKAQQDRPILLVDQRGTGASNKLSCDSILDEEDMTESMDLTQVKGMIKECLEVLPGDPRFYTTSVAVQDLDAVRVALGIEQLNLWGGSYGTRVALHYLRRYPEHTRSVIIDGVVPADMYLGPAIALDAQTSVEHAFSRCAEIDSCHEQFGDLGQKLRELKASLARSPQTVTMPHPRTAVPTTETVNDETLAGVIRLSAYSPFTRALLPTMIDRAHAGDMTMLAAQSIQINDNFTGLLATGMHNAVMCSEDTPFYGDVSIEQLNDTFMGSLHYEYLVESCRHWPVGIVDDDFSTPVVSDKPVLILSGEFDPVTPPAYGDQALKTLSNARHLVVAEQGHIVSGVGCMPTLLDNFIETLDADALEAECLERAGGLPFFIDAIGPTP